VARGGPRRDGAPLTVALASLLELVGDHGSTEFDDHLLARGHRTPADRRCACHWLGSSAVVILAVLVVIALYRLTTMARCSSHCRWRSVASACSLDVI
jgi:hypothetical protein